MISAVILCGGSGTRFGESKNKLLYDNGALVKNAVLPFLSLDIVSEVILVCKKQERAEFAALFSSPKLRFCDGGDTRFFSSYNGVSAVSPLCKTVIIHDGARPFLSIDLILRVIDSAQKLGSGVAALPVTDTLRRGDGVKLSDTLLRDGLFAIQTPQAFDKELLLAAYKAAISDGNTSFTDDSSVFSYCKNDVFYVRGEEDNRKLTTKKDLPPKFFSGVGFDLHRTAQSRQLVLCGVKIDCPFGLVGHSDADAPVHALMDAILSALGLPDIGHYFPDTDDKYLGISSITLLSEVMEKVAEHNALIQNVSIAILCEAPKLAPYIRDMKACLSSVLNVARENIGISVTTLERFGDVGNKDAIASYATVSLKVD